MRLLDQVCAMTSDLVVMTPDGRSFNLPSPAHIADAVRNAPLRYILDEAVVEFLVELGLGQSARLTELADLVRMPAPLFWLEWNDSERNNALFAFKGARRPVAQEQNRPAGVLVQSDATGRRGRIQSVWTSDDGAIDLAPMELEFDLDTPDFAALHLDFVRATTLGEPALDELLGHAGMRLRGEWRDYFQAAAANAADFERALHENLCAVVRDFPCVLAFVLAINARNAFDASASNLTKLNRARVRRGKAPLLDHIEVRARLDVAAYDQHTAASRRAARQHFVSGHLVRRAGGVFWRRAHLRGDPERGMLMSRSLRFDAEAARQLARRCANASG